ncbi:hypothetical protein AMECASPLE_015318 [Ameca splendens]|uniref:Uncharacterized protein n=1 Tax=Ameca splendens TaxID=208324 RepID=A0ABV0ZAP9_9TELE
MWKHGNRNELSEMCSSSQGSVKHSAADGWKSEFFVQGGSSSTLLLTKEQTFTRWMDGSGACSPFWLDH